MAAIALLFLATLAITSAYPTEDLVIAKYDNGGPRYQYVPGADGKLVLSDMWMKTSDLQEAARYNPDQHNIYHLYTRQNPVVSQPLLIDNDQLLGITNYDPQRRTVVILHGWRSDSQADVNTVLVPAFLSAEDVNVIVCDWNAGSGTINYMAAIANTIKSGESVARFINWLNEKTGASPLQYHLVGHSLGAHKAGIIGRNINGNIAYITALDPAFPGWIRHEAKLRASDSSYTEVIHTNAGALGYLATMGHTDFYPNGGINMPGCENIECDHAMSYYYFAESLISGGFSGRRCATYPTAMTGNCVLLGRLNMGGLVPKTGSSGIYYLETNDAAPYSK